MLRDPVFFAPLSAGSPSGAATVAAGADSGRVSTPSFSRVRSIGDDTAVIETVYQDGFCHVWSLGDAGSKRSFQLRELVCFTLQLQPDVRLRPRALHVCTAPGPVPVVDTLVESVLRARDERRLETTSDIAVESPSAAGSNSAAEDLFAAYRPLAAVMLLPSNSARADSNASSAHASPAAAGSGAAALAHDLGVCDVVLWSLPRQHAVHLLRFERAVTGIHSTPSLLLVATSSAIYGFSAHTLALAFRVDCGPQPFGDGFAAIALSEAAPAAAQEFVSLSAQDQRMPACLLAYSPPAASVPALQLRAAAVASGLSTANDGADVSAGVTLHVRDAGDSSDDGNSDSDSDVEVVGAGGAVVLPKGPIVSPAAVPPAAGAARDAASLATREAADDVRPSTALPADAAAPMDGAPDAGSAAAAMAAGARSLTEGSYGLAREAASLLRRLREAAVDLLASPPAALGVTAGGGDARGSAQETESGPAARMEPAPPSESGSSSAAASVLAASPAPSTSGSAAGLGAGLGLGDGAPCNAVAVCDVWQLIADFALWRASYDPSQQALHPQSRPAATGAQAAGAASTGLGLLGSTAGGYAAPAAEPSHGFSSALQQAPPDFVPNAAIATIGAGRSVACITLQAVPAPASAFAAVSAMGAAAASGSAVPATPAGIAGAAATPLADGSATVQRPPSNAAAQFVLAAANTLGQRIFCFDAAVVDSRARQGGAGTVAAASAPASAAPSDAISPARYAVDRAPFSLRCMSRCELERGITAARITRISVSAGGAWLSAVSDRGTAHVWPLMDASETAAGKADAASAARAAPAGAASVLATAAAAGHASSPGASGSPRLPPRGGPSPGASAVGPTRRPQRRSVSGLANGHVGAAAVPRPLAGAVFAAGRVRLTDLLPAASAAILAAILASDSKHGKEKVRRSPHLKGAAGPGGPNRGPESASVSSTTAVSPTFSVAGVRGWAAALLRGNRSPFGAEGLIGYAVRTAREARRARMLAEGTLSAAIAECSAAAAEAKLHAQQTGLGSTEGADGRSAASGGVAGGSGAGVGRAAAGSGRRWNGDSSDEDDERSLQRHGSAHASALARRSLRPLATDGSAASAAALAASGPPAGDSSTAAAVAAAAVVAQLQAELHTQLCALAPVSWDGVLLGDSLLSVCRSGFIALTGLRARAVVHAQHGTDAVGAGVAVDSGSATRSGSSTHGAKGSPLLAALGFGGSVAAAAAAAPATGISATRPADGTQTGLLLSATAADSTAIVSSGASSYPAPSAPLAVPVPLSEGWIDLATAGDVANLMLPGGYSFASSQPQIGSAATTSIAYAGSAGASLNAGHWGGAGPADISWPSGEDLTLPPSALHSLPGRESSRGAGGAGTDASVAAAQGEGAQASGETAPSEASTDSTGSASVLAAAAAMLQPAAAAAGNYIVSVASAVGSAAATGAAVVAARAAALPARLREGGVWDQVARGAAVTRDAASAAVGSAVAGVLGTLRPVVAGLSNPMHPDVLVIAKLIGSWDLRRQEHWPPVVALAAHWPYALLQPLYVAIALQQLRSARASLTDAPGRAATQPAPAFSAAAVVVASATLPWSRLDETLLPQLKLLPRYRRHGGLVPARATSTPAAVAVAAPLVPEAPFDAVSPPPSAAAVLPVSPDTTTVTGSASAATERAAAPAAAEDTVPHATSAAAVAGSAAGAAASLDHSAAAAAHAQAAAPVQDTSGFVSPPSETEGDGVDAGAVAAAAAAASKLAVHSPSAAKQHASAAGSASLAPAAASAGAALADVAGAAPDVDDAVTALLAQPLQSVRLGSSASAVAASAVVDVPLVADAEGDADAGHCDGAGDRSQAVALRERKDTATSQSDSAAEMVENLDKLARADAAVSISAEPTVIAGAGVAGGSGLAAAADSAAVASSDEEGLVVTGQERLMALSALLESAHKQAAVAAASASGHAFAGHSSSGGLGAGASMGDSMSVSMGMAMSLTAAAPGAGMMTQSMSLLPGVGGGTGGLGVGSAMGMLGLGGEPRDALFSPAASALFASCMHHHDHHDDGEAGGYPEGMFAGSLATRSSSLAAPSSSLSAPAAAVAAMAEIPAPFLSARSSIAGTSGPASASSAISAADGRSALGRAAGAGAFTFERERPDHSPSDVEMGANTQAASPLGVAAAAGAPSAAADKAIGLKLTLERPIATAGFTAAAAAAVGGAGDHVSSGSAYSSSASTSASSSSSAAASSASSTKGKSKRGKGGRR